MSKCDSLLKTGDRGQRYEIRAVGMQGTEFVVGWTDRADGGNLAQMIEKHPVWKLSQIVDRRPPVIAEKRSGEQLLSELANAIIKYRVDGEKDFAPVNRILELVDQYRRSAEDGRKDHG